MHRLIALISPLSSVVNIFAGLWIAADFRFRVVYGDAFSNTGVILVILGVLQCPILCSGIYSSRTHNKAVLVSHMGYLVGLIFVQAIVLIIVASISIPRYSLEFRMSCTGAAGGGEADTPECEAFLTDRLRQRLYRLWAQMRVLAKRSPAVREEMKLISQGGGCCGFGPPGLCRTGRYDIAQQHGLYLSQGPDFVGELHCGNTKGWYPEMKTCQLTDGVGSQIEGCPYDLPVGVCSQMRLTPNSAGCVVELQEILLRRLEPLAWIVFGFLIIEMIALVVVTCYCMRHKENYILPQRGWTISEDGRSVFVDSFWTQKKSVKLDDTSEYLSDDEGELLEEMRRDALEMEQKKKIAMGIDETS